MSIVCAPLELSAQGYSITGRVVAEGTGDALPAANILLSSSAHTGRASTDLNGGFRVSGLPAGVYRLEVSYVGFETFVKDDVDASAQDPLVVEMSEALYLLNPVNVTASRRQERVIESPAAVMIVDENEIATRPSLTPVDHLSSLPGIDVVTTGINQERVAVRGFNGTINSAVRLLVFSDYRITALPALRFNMPQLIPTTNDDIERIEVVYGPGSALYGPNAGGGVMHIVTKSPLTSEGVYVSAGVGERSLGMGSFRFSRKLREDVGFKISARYYRAEDWEHVDPAEPDTIVLGRPALSGRTPVSGPIPNTRDFDVENLSTEARLDWNAGSFSTVVSAGHARTSNIELTDIGASQLEDWSTTFVQARVFTDDFFAQAFVNRTDDGGRSYFLRSGDLIVDNATQFVAQIQHGIPMPGGNQRVTVGGDVLLTRPNSDGTVYGRNENDDDINELGAYIEAESLLGPAWKASGALRLDKHNHLEDAVLSPRVALTFRPQEQHTFRATFNRAYEAPLAISLFDDLIVLPSLGPLPFALRVRGVPPETGYAFNRDTSGGVGGLYMQSPFLPDDFGGKDVYLPADATLMWDAVVGFMLSQGVDLTGIPAPSSADVSTTLASLNPNTQAFDPIQPDRVVDIPPLKARRTNVFELGYKGTLGDRAILNVSVFHEKNVDFSGVFLVETPNVFLDATTLTSYLAQFMPADAAGGLAAGIATLPLGTVTPREADPADILLTTRSLGETSYWGGELGLTIYGENGLSFDAGYSYINDNFFPRRAGEPNDIALNAPRHKFSGGIRYRHPDPAYDATFAIRGRYVGAFPVISGIGTGDIDGYGLVDFEASTGIPSLPGIRVSLSIDNVLDNTHREFINVAEIGRLAMLRLSYSR